MRPSMKTLIHALPLVFTVLFVAVVTFLVTQLAMQVAGIAGAILVVFFIALALLTLLKMSIEDAKVTNDAWIAEQDARRGQRGEREGSGI